jgi:predicted O-methyltransferase YrrM
MEGSKYNYLEIGIFNGDSIADMARAYPGKHIYAIDPFIEDGYTSHTTKVDRDQHMPEQKANTLKNIEGFDNITLFETTSKEFAESLNKHMAQIMNVAWVLIDGSHHYEDVVVDYELAMQLIGNKPGGIVFDDVTIPGVERAHREFLEKYGDRITLTRDLYNVHPGNIIGYRINKE